MSNGKACYLQRNLPRLLVLPFLMKAFRVVSIYCYPNKSTHHNDDSSAQNGPTFCPLHSQFFQFVTDTSKIKEASHEEKILIFIQNIKNNSQFLHAIRSKTGGFIILKQQFCSFGLLKINSQEPSFLYTPSGNQNTDLWNVTKCVIIFWPNNTNSGTICIKDSKNYLKIEKLKTIFSYIN